MISPKPFLLSEITKAEKVTNEVTKIKGYETSEVYIYGFVKRKYEGEEHPDPSEGFIRPPSLVITDESGEAEVLVRPKPWEKSHIQIVQSCYNNDMVIVKGKFNWYEKENEDVYNINIEGIDLVSQENLDGARNFFLSRLSRVRMGDQFSTDHFLYHFLKSRNVPLRENEDTNTFSINAPIESEELVSVILAEPSQPKKNEPKAMRKSANTPKKTRKKPETKTKDKPVKKEEPKEKPKKSTKSKKNDVTIEQVSEFLEEKGKVSVTQVSEKFGIEEDRAWNLVVNLKREDKSIEIENENNETFLIKK